MSAAEEKSREILEILQQVLMPLQKDRTEQELMVISEMVLDKFVTITAPDRGDSVIGLIKMVHGGLGGASSTKPGNLKFNLRRLLIDGSESILVVMGALEYRPLLALAALVIWDKMYSNSKIALSERHAMVIWTMWITRNERNCVASDKILEAVNTQLKRYAKLEMEKKELKYILSDLSKIKCIEKVNSTQWWLREWVRISYG